MRLLDLTQIEQASGVVRPLLKRALDQGFHLVGLQLVGIGLFPLGQPVGVGLVGRAWAASRQIEAKRQDSDHAAHGNGHSAGLWCGRGFNLGVGLAQQPPGGLGMGGDALILAQQPALGQVVDLGQLAAVNTARGVRHGQHGAARQTRDKGEGGCGDKASGDPQGDHGRWLAHYAGFREAGFVSGASFTPE